MISNSKVEKTSGGKVGILSCSIDIFYLDFDNQLCDVDSQLLYLGTKDNVTSVIVLL